VTPSTSSGGDPVFTVLASVLNPTEVNASDFAIVVIPTFLYARAGSVSVTSTGVTGAAAGLRTATLAVVQGEVRSDARSCVHRADTHTHTHSHAHTHTHKQTNTQTHTQTNTHTHTHTHTQVLPPAPPGRINESHIVVSLGSSVALSTDKSLTGAEVSTRTSAYREREISIISSTYG
jgi:hypothetical protein